MPGPPPLSSTHTEPQLGKGAGPWAHSARGISWLGGQWRGLAGSRNNRTREGGTRPQVGAWLLLSCPPLQGQSPGYRGGGVCRPGNPGMVVVGGKSRPRSAGCLPPSRDLAMRICCAPPLPPALPARAGFSRVCNLQTGAAAAAAAALRTPRRPLPCKPEGVLAMHASPGGPGPARSGPHPSGPFSQATLSSLPSFR